LAKLFEKNSNKSKSAPNTPTLVRKVNPIFSLPNSPEKVTLPATSVMNRLSKVASAVSEAVGDVFGAATSTSVSEDWSTDIADEVLLESMGYGTGKAEQKRKASKSPSLDKSINEDTVEKMQAQIDSHSLLLEELKQNLAKEAAETGSELNQMATSLATHDADLGQRMPDLENRVVILEDFKEKMTTDAWQTFFEKQMTDIKKIVLDASKANLYNMAVSNAEQGIYITGIDNIKRLFQLTGNWDPAMVIGELLLQCDRQIYGGKDRIIIPVPKGKIRAEAKTGIVYFRSIQTKKEAAIMIKQLLSHRKARGIGLRDLFPQEKMEEVNQLNKMGNYLRLEKVISRYRVININNAPVIQVIYEDGKFYTTMEQDKIEEELKVMPQDDEVMEQEDSQQTSGSNEEQQQQQHTIAHSGGGARPKQTIGNSNDGAGNNISGEETPRARWRHWIE